jgi:proteasome accessory factor B
MNRRDDGTIVVRLAVRNVAAFRSWVLGLLDDAEVLAPADLRDDIADWLSAIVAAGVR